MTLPKYPEAIITRIPAIATNPGISGSPTAAMHMAYRPDIDGLRAIAVLAVVGFHAFPIWVPGGFIGVDIFFVISGFLISSIIFNNLERGRFSLSDFYSRRIRRIFPTLMVVLAASVAFGWIVLFKDEYERLGKHVLAAAGFVSNFALLEEAGYFDASATTKPLLHLWSLAVEEQFYVFWPFLVACLWRWRIDVRWPLWVIGGASFIANVVLVSSDPAAGFYLPWTRMWELMAGSALAYITIRPQTIPPPSVFATEVASATGIVLIIAGIMGLSLKNSFPGWWALVPVAGAFLVILAGPEAAFNRKALSNRILVWFGLISYPLYLWHWPLLSFAQIIDSETPSKTIRVAAVCLSVLLAWLTYRFIERPARSRSRVAVVPVLTIGMIALGVFGLAVWSSSGMARQRHITPIVALGTMLDTTVTPRCLAEYRSLFSPKFIETRDFCFKSPSRHEKQSLVFVVGDSHANRLALGLDAIGINVINLGRGTCLAFMHYEGQGLECHETFDRLFESLSNADTSRSTIILTAFFERPYDGRITKTSTASIREDARKTFRALSGFQQVILMLDVPELPFDPRKCMGRPIFKTKVDAACSFDVSFHTATSRYQSELRAATDGFANVTVYNPTSLFCGPLSCAAARNSVTLYSDRSHLSLEGSILVAKQLSALFLPQR